LTFDKGIVFAATAYNASVIAINATDGRIIWQSQELGDPKTGYNIPSQPVVWKDYVIVGSAGGTGPFLFQLIKFKLRLKALLELEVL
jgi:outer membrane protein assembly factor BamB